MDSNNEVEKKEISRKDFLRAGLLAGLGVVISTAAVTISRNNKGKYTDTGDVTIKKKPDFKTITIDANSDLLLHMQQDVKRALLKPLEERKWLMIIDTRKCVGCHACTIACVSEHKLPPGCVYRPVVTENSGTYPNLRTQFFPRPCMQCDNPSCVSVCPVEATYKRLDGIVEVNYNKCIGCRYCLSACPYGARTSDFGNYFTDNTPEIQEYEKLTTFEYGKLWKRDGHGSPVGNARKCNFCLHRLDEGELPMCISTCIGRANYFGDANDTKSIVYKMLSASNQIKLLEEMGTKPAVFYLI